MRKNKEVKFVPLLERTYFKSFRLGNKLCLVIRKSDVLCCLKELEKKKIPAETGVTDGGVIIVSGVVLWSDVKRFFGDKK